MGGKHWIVLFLERDSPCFFHFPPCLVSEAGEALGFKKVRASAKGKSQLCEEGGLQREAPSSQTAFISNLSQKGLWEPGFGKRKNLQNGKNQNSKKLSRCRALSGKKAGLQTPCFFRSGGGKEKNHQGNLPKRTLRSSSSVWTTECLRLQLKGLSLKIAFEVVVHVCGNRNTLTVLPALGLTSLVFKHTLKFEN